jgi:hypothetical protein
VLQTAEPPERQQWIDQYKAIATGVDAALFMTEARLKLRYGIDFKRFKRVDERDTRSRRRQPQREKATGGN